MSDQRASPESSFAEWSSPLAELVDGIRSGTMDVLEGAFLEDSLPERLARPVSQGAGDLTFGLDLPSEEFIDRWFLEQARLRPLSLMTEDRGWRHRGPRPGPPPPTQPGLQRVPSIELPDFDHGGPRIAIDPVDGTRNLMADLRSAWTVISFAPPGAGMPRVQELTGGIVSELPTSRAARFRTLRADGTTCSLAERELSSGRTLSVRDVRVDSDDRVDHGYFPFFRYKPDLRPDIARLEAAFFLRLEQLEAADVRSVYDDQYISNAGQLALLLTGTYRMIVDARALVARRRGVRTVTSKPYDVGGAIVCARSAGCVVTAADGGALDYPMDTETPVDMAGYANAATHARLEPHWLAVLAETAPQP